MDKNVVLKFLEGCAYIDPKMQLDYGSGPNSGLLQVVGKIDPDGIQSFEMWLMPELFSEDLRRIIQRKLLKSSAGDKKTEVKSEINVSSLKRSIGDMTPPKKGEDDKPFSLVRILDPASKRLSPEGKTLYDRACKEFPMAGKRRSSEELRELEIIKSNILHGNIKEVEDFLASC